MLGGCAAQHPPASVASKIVNSTHMKFFINLTTLIQKNHMMNFKSEISLFLFSVIWITGLHAQTIKDIDGNVYQTITFGSQTSMKENLKVTHYRNGDPIETTTINICNESAPKYQWTFDCKNNQADSCGRLYTWYVVTDERKVCPAGWHVPSGTEWMALRHHLGIDTVSGKTGSPKIAIQSGFATTFNGKRTCGGAFNSATPGVWWTLAENESLSNLSDLAPNIGSRIKTYREENNGYPVRCVKD